MGYIVHYDVAALIMISAVAVHFYSKKTINTSHTSVFKILLFTILISNLSDLISLFTIEFYQKTPVWVNYVVNQAYFVSISCIAAIYMWYLLYQIDDEKRNKRIEKLCIIGNIINIVLIMTTPFTKWIFYIDENKQYIHGKYLSVVYIIIGIYVLSAMIYMTCNIKKFTSRQIVTIGYYSLSCIVALIIQLKTGTVMLIEFAMSLALVLVYLSLENPLDFSDKKLDVFNEEAFLQVTKRNIKKDKKFQVLGIQLDGLKYVRETMGDKVEMTLLQDIATYLKGVVGEDNLYYVSHDIFAVVECKYKEKWEQCIEEIQHRFEEKFIVNKVEISISDYMCMVAFPETVVRYEDIMDMLEYSLLKAKTSKKDEVVYETDSIILKGRRENKIIQIMKDALKENKFEVFYQPIYSVEKKRYTSAEALLRLQHEELGFIGPDEFIPLAERSGLILEIGEYVFREVCKFLSIERLWEKGIEYIDVNLSVVQCMQEKLYETLLMIMDEYNVEYKYINLEITETAAIISSKALINNMEKLSDKGVNFSLDDYGTGYSNTGNLIKYKFHAIKIDKSMVWLAMKDQKAMLALKHTIAMVKEMNMLLVAEGVETKEHVYELEKMGCDFFQGYYYLKPVNKALFLDAVLKMNVN